MSVQNLQLAGYLLTGNLSTFLYAERSFGSLYDCPQVLSSLHEADKKFTRIPIYYQDTVMCIAPITKKIFNYGTPLTCDNIPQNVVALDLDFDEQYVLTPKLVLRDTPLLFEPKQTPSAKSLRFSLLKTLHIIPMLIS